MAWKVDANDLYEYFVANEASPSEISQMNLETMTAHIADLRATSEPYEDLSPANQDFCDAIAEMDDEEIAVQILEVAQG
jgi:DNA-binding GntR family transcriptional regulator